MSKSRKQRERQRAYVAGQLYEWGAAHADKRPTMTTPAPDFAIRTLDGASWSEDSRYMRWLLPVCAVGNRPAPLPNP
jgi:hypothetical protein